jgi:hypothetical protein
MASIENSFKVTLTITETDEVDTPLATFLYSETTTTQQKGKHSAGTETVLNSRIDVLVSSNFTSVIELENIPRD